METETEIRRQILQLEFQHKKDIAEINKVLDRVTRRQDRNQKQLDHITKLTGIAFEDLESHKQKMQDAGEILSRQK